MGKYDKFLVGISTSTPSGNVPRGKYAQYLSGLEGQEDVASEAPTDDRSMFERFGGALPVAGSVIGGLAGTGAGAVTGPGAIATGVGGAALGGAAGESARQLLGRVLGERVPETSLEAAKDIGLEGAGGAVGELTGMGIGRVARGAFKAFPKVAQSFSGTPSINIARAQKRGFGVFFPGMGREAAGEVQGKAEQAIVDRMFTPEERVLLRAKDPKYADKLMKSVMFKQETGRSISPKEAIGLRMLAPVKRAADTLRGITKNVELDKATTGARAVIAEQYPELARRLGQTERSITASQLRKPLPVKRTNPNEISGLATLIGSGFGFVNPKLALGLLAASPLSMGLAGAAMGQVRKSIPRVARRGIQRTGTQAGARELMQALGDR